MLKDQKLVNMIDSNLVFRRPLEIKSPTRLIYEVERKGIIYVLKIINFENQSDKNHFIKERDALIKVKEHKIERITNLLEIYESDNQFHSLLKEYTEGDVLYYSKAPFDINKIKSQIEDTVDGLHGIKISYMRLSDKDIVISPNGSNATLIDLHPHCIDCCEEDFNEGKNSDKYFLNLIFSRYDNRR